MEASSGLAIYTDGGSRGNPGPGASAYVVYKDGIIVFEQGHFLKDTTNNLAEYFAVLMALNWLHKNISKYQDDEINFYSDSELVVRQINKVYKVKDIKIKKLYSKVESIIAELNKNIIFNHVKREKNKAADELVNVTIDENT